MCDALLEIKNLISKCVAHSGKVICLCGAVLFQAGALFSQEKAEVAATPQRPSFSTNTATTAAGWFEFEGGVSLDDETQNTPVLLKFGISDRVEVFFGSTALMSSGRDFEDITVGSRWRFRDGRGNGPSLAGQVSLTSFRSDFIDAIDYSFLFILSHTVGRASIDFNAGLSFPDQGDEQVFGILTLSRTLSPKVSGYAEIIVNHDTGLSRQVAIGSFGIGFNLNRRFVLDSAVNLNIANAESDFQFLAGITTLLSRFR